MTVYNVITKKEIEDRIETNNTLRAGNIFQITNGDQYILKHDGTIKIHKPQSHISYSHSAQNTRKHSNPHIKESLANLRHLHNLRRNTSYMMKSLGTLSITSKPINKRRKQKSTKQVKGSINYSGYPNYVRKQTRKNKKKYQKVKN
jgi:hypothetical protein